MADHAAATGRALVTGCAGFIGSHLAERLVDDGWEVSGVDCFTPFYDRRLKERNLERLLDEPRFELHELDLSRDPLASLTEGADVIFHLAGQPGVRQSFGPGAAMAIRNNAIASWRLMVAAARSRPRMFVYASSSTVYGHAHTFPTGEEEPLRPISPYGESKVLVERLAGEHAAGLGLQTVGLRYFSAYGPRQRPDLAVGRFIRMALAGEPLPVKGSGRQQRDFTFISDIVEMTLAAARHGQAGRIYNVGGGSPASLCEVIEMIDALTGIKSEIAFEPAPRGDTAQTCADSARALAELGYTPRVGLAEGLAAQLEWTLEGMSTVPGPRQVPVSAGRVLTL